LAATPDCERENVHHTPGAAAGALAHSVFDRLVFNVIFNMPRRSAMVPL
jgi:hypothetical protein